MADSRSVQDLSDHLNREDALAHLNRALDRNDEPALAAWARRFGAAALENAGYDDDLTKAQEELTEAEAQVSALTSCASDVIAPTRQLIALLDGEDWSEGFAASARELIETLNGALDALEAA